MNACRLPKRCSPNECTVSKTPSRLFVGQAQNINTSLLLLALMKREKSSYSTRMRKVSSGLISIVLTDCETADDERVFLIDQGLQFRFGTLDGDATCSWKDLSGEEGDRWEFVSSKVCARLRQPRLYLLTKACSLFPKPRIHCSSLLSYIACLSGYIQYYFVKCRTNYCIEIFTLTRGSHRRTAPSSKRYRGTRHSQGSSKT